MFVIIDAVVEVVFFTSKGSETKRFLVGQNQNCRVIEIYPYPYEIHGVECMSSSAMMLEIKEGPYSLETAIVMASFRVVIRFILTIISSFVLKAKLIMLSDSIT